jgi:hypothetical protein
VSLFKGGTVPLPAQSQQIGLTESSPTAARAS